MKCKLLTNCCYTISRKHISLLSSKPHGVRLLVSSGTLNLPGSPQNLLQTTLCDIISETLVLIFVTFVN